MPRSPSYLSGGNCCHFLKHTRHWNLYFCPRDVIVPPPKCLIVPSQSSVMHTIDVDAIFIIPLIIGSAWKRIVGCMNLLANAKHDCTSDFNFLSTGYARGRTFVLVGIYRDAMIGPRNVYELDKNGTSELISSMSRFGGQEARVGLWMED